MKTNRYVFSAAAAAVLLAAYLSAPVMAGADKEEGWTPLIKGNSLDGWTTHGSAKWRIENGVIIGTSPGGQGHIYAAPVVSDLEVKGTFRVTSQGKTANSGLYFRANPPKDKPEDFPLGYEAQICNNTEAFTGWLWKPGKPTGKASKLLTKDGEWFTMRVKAVATTSRFG